MNDKLTEYQIAVLHDNALKRLSGRILDDSEETVASLVSTAIAEWDAQTPRSDEFVIGIPSDHTIDGHPISLAFPIAASFEFCDKIIAHLDGLAAGDPEAVFAVLHRWAEWQSACADYDSPYFTALLGASLVVPHAISHLRITPQKESAIRRFRRLATPGISLDDRGRLIVAAVLPFETRFNRHAPLAPVKPFDIDDSRALIRSAMQDLAGLDFRVHPRLLPEGSIHDYISNPLTYSADPELSFIDLELGHEFYMSICGYAVVEGPSAGLVDLLLRPDGLSGLNDALSFPEHKIGSALIHAGFPVEWFHLYAPMHGALFRDQLVLAEDIRLLMLDLFLENEDAIVQHSDFTFSMRGQDNEVTIDLVSASGAPIGSISGELDKAEFALADLAPLITASFAFFQQRFPVFTVRGMTSRDPTWDSFCFAEAMVSARPFCAPRLTIPANILICGAEVFLETGCPTTLFRILKIAATLSHDLIVALADCVDSYDDGLDELLYRIASSRPDLDADGRLLLPVSLPLFLSGAPAPSSALAQHADLGGLSRAIIAEYGVEICFLNYVYSLSELIIDSPSLDAFIEHLHALNTHESGMSPDCLLQLGALYRANDATTKSLPAPAYIAGLARFSSPSDSLVDLFRDRLDVGLSGPLDGPAASSAFAEFSEDAFSTGVRAAPRSLTLFRDCIAFGTIWGGLFEGLSRLPVSPARLNLLAISVRDDMDDGHWTLDLRVSDSSSTFPHDLSLAFSSLRSFGLSHQALEREAVSFLQFLGVKLADATNLSDSIAGPTSQALH